MNKFLCAFPFLQILSAHSATETSPEWGYAADAAWHNKYVSEGRDNLASGGITFISAAATNGDLSLSLVYGAAESERYDELNAGIGYHRNFGEIEADLTYTRLQFPDDGEHDNEASLALSMPLYEMVISNVSYVYSTEAEGGFLTLALVIEKSLWQDRSILSLALSESVDFGYASEAYNGPNNFDVSVSIETQVSDNFSVAASLNHSYAQADVKRSSLGDISWGSIAVMVNF